MLILDANVDHNKINFKQFSDREPSVDMIHREL